MGGLGWLVACQANLRRMGLTSRAHLPACGRIPRQPKLLGYYCWPRLFKLLDICGSLFGRIKVGPDLSDNRRVKFWRVPQQGAIY